MQQDVVTPIGVPGAFRLPLPDLSTLRRLLGHRRNLIGLSILLPVVFLAFAAPLLPIPGPLAAQPEASLSSPSADHFFGTDRLGRDLFSRTLAGARTSLTVGFVVAAGALIVGIILGTVSGFMGKFFDGLIMAIVDILLSFPGLLLAIGMVAVFGSGLWQVILAIMFADIPRAIRLQRSLVLSLKSRPYMEAARMASAPTWWLLIRHAIPNTLAPMLVVGSVYAANAILVEASLSFLGLGITPPEPSWGNIIREGQAYLQRAWWISTFPGLAILVVALSLHFISDGVRESLDPSMRS
jgi:peptide/nickel transport system permease protein